MTERTAKKTKTKRAKARPAKPEPPLEVRESAIQGRGVYATKLIARNDWIIEYVGERISHEEADMRYDDENMERHHTFLFTVDEKICIDALIGGNESRFINHSCAPNCEAILSGKKIFIGAMREIQPGEELTYDYGYFLEGESIDEALRKYPCRCGAATCRGTILKLDSVVKKR